MTISPCFILLWTAICFQCVTISFHIWTSYKYLAAGLFCSTNTAEFPLVCWPVCDQQRLDFSAVQIWQREIWQLKVNNQE